MILGSGAILLLVNTLFDGISIKIRKLTEDDMAQMLHSKGERKEDIQ